MLNGRSIKNKEKFSKGYAKWERVMWVRRSLKEFSVTCCNSLPRVTVYVYVCVMNMVYITIQVYAQVCTFMHMYGL